MSDAHKCGWVTLMGPPNAGKSTLFNTYLGQKVAIVTSKPQTTRNQINGILTQPDAQIIFLDTPGVHEVRGKIHRLLMQSAWQAMSGGDAVLVVVDSDLYSRKPELLAKDLNQIIQPVANCDRPVLVALNKIDMFRDKSKLLPVIEEISKLWPKAEFFPISALNNVGMDDLLVAVKKTLPEGPAEFPADQIATAPMRFLAAEMVREKLFIRLRQELPYNIHVQVEHWEEDEHKDLTRINAVIFVSRNTHKAMVIGKQGRTLKAVGTEARKDIEDLLGKRVYLELWVKIREGWTEDDKFLHEIGLTPGATL